VVGKSRAAIGNKIRRCEIGAASRATRDRAADCDGNLGIDLTDLLNEAVTSVVSPSASQVKLLQRLDSLRQRIAANRFHLALLGQFKRGKSTLLNALLGADVLPTGVIPVTAIPIFLQAASTPSLRVTFTGGRIEEYEADTPSAFRERLTAFVTEEANPRNMLGVARVELRLPSELLASGVVLIDTPGVGSTFHHNTAAANAVLAECDAAFFVVSPDPPITEVEVQFLASVRQTVARIIVVLNKIDTVEPDERIIVEAFLRRVLAEQAGLDMTTPIFCLSGRDALRARLVGDCGAQEASGIAELEAYLTQFLALEKQTTLRAAVARKASALIGDLQMETSFLLKALSMPLTDLEQRMALFDDAVSKFEAERRVAADLLAGDRVRAFEELEADAERLRIQGGEALVAELDQTLARNADAEQARAALAAMVVRFFDAALTETVAKVRKRLTATLRAHQLRTDQLIAVVRRTAADLLEISSYATEASEELEIRHDPFWVTRAQPELLGGIVPSVLDQFLPEARRQIRLRQRLLKEMDAVLLRNVENLRWATRQNLEDTFRRFGADLNERLALSLVATRGAMVAARDRRTQQLACVKAEIETMGVTLSRLNTMQTALSDLVK
jgi:GTP-binding protein EngB required for normal cell division